MAITVAERAKSRTTSGTSAKREYIIKGTTSDVAAKAEMLAATGTCPLVIANLFRDDAACDVEEISGEGDGIYIGTANWKADTGGQQQQPNSFSISFDISGNTQHIQFSKATIASYAATGTAPDYKNAIGVTPDGTVEGTDIVVPYHTWQMNYTFNDEDITVDYYTILSDAVGCFNTGAWKHFADSVALLTGVSGQRRFLKVVEDASVYVWDLTFRFAVGRNKTGIVIGDITGIAKKAWEYLWVQYEDEIDTDANKLVRRPRFAYVEKVYDGYTMTALGIGA